MVKRYPLAKIICCPYFDCDGEDFEDLGGASECAITEYLDSNKVSNQYHCVKCDRSFIFEYKCSKDPEL